MKLNESGLLSHDLDYLILPLVEIDTFESKIDNKKAVVVAFFIFEQEPAKDLERFIEKSEITILDTETSPAPTEDGYYVVFVELDRNENMPADLMGLIDNVSNLTNLDKWQFKTFNDDSIYELTKENLFKHVNLDPASIPDSVEDTQDEIEDIAKQKETDDTDDELEKETPTLESKIMSILKNGLMESVEIDENVVYLASPGSTIGYRVIQTSEYEPSIPVIGLEIGNPFINESARLSRILGPAYCVEAVDNALLVSSEHGYLILEPLD